MTKESIEPHEATHVDDQIKAEQDVSWGKHTWEIETKNIDFKHELNQVFVSPTNTIQPTDSSASWTRFNPKKMLIAMTTKLRRIGTTRLTTPLANSPIIATDEENAI